jgi:hypothetical protein
MTINARTAAAALFVVAISAAAAAQESSREAFALQRILNSRVLPEHAKNDPKWRTALADAVHKYCESVLAQVPRNTPQEDQWVDNEIQGASTQPNRADFEKRMQRLQNSAEYARNGLRHVLSECSSITSSLMEQKQPSTTEAVRWLRLTQLFMTEDETWRLAKIIGLVSDCVQINSARARPDFFQKGLPPGSHDKNDLCFIWGMLPYSIVSQAAIPLLEGQ